MSQILNRLFLTLALGAVCAAPLAAQTETPTAPPAQAAEAPEAPAELQPGDQYLDGTFGDWTKRCIRAPQGDDPCQIVQLIDDGQGTPVAEIAMQPLPEGAEAAAGGTIITPLETLLTSQITLRVDDGEPRVYPFTFCSEVGCVARVGFRPDELQAFRRGAVARIIIRPAQAPDQQVTLEVSLTGFTAGFASLSVPNAN